MLAYKYLSVILTLLLTTSFAGAYSVLVWDKDEGDEYEGVGSEEGIIASLNNLGHNVTTHTDENLPDDISSYDMVFALTGWYSC